MTKARKVFLPFTDFALGVVFLIFNWKNSYFKVNLKNNRGLFEISGRHAQPKYRCWCWNQYLRCQNVTCRPLIESEPLALPGTGTLGAGCNHQPDQCRLSFIGTGTSISRVAAEMTLAPQMPEESIQNRQLAPAPQVPGAG